jgi:hypothetical protein
LKNDLKRYRQSYTSSSEMPKYYQRINKEGEFKKDINFWSKEFPEIIFFHKGYDVLYEEQHEDLIDYCAPQYQRSMSVAPEWRKRVGIERNTRKSEDEYELDLLVFHDNILSALDINKMPYKFGKADAEMAFKKEDYPDHPDFVERSGATECGVIEETYKYVLQKLRPGERRVVFREACLVGIENVIERIHENHYIKERKFSDDYRLVVSNSPEPGYGQMFGVLRDEHQITTNKDDTPYHKVLFVECISKKQMLIGELNRIDKSSQRKKENGVCCICKEYLEMPFGNNPHPIRKRGKCCDECNYSKVLPTRMSLEGGSSKSHEITMKLITNWELKKLQRKLIAIMNTYPTYRLYHEQVEEDVGLNQLHYRTIELVEECGAHIELDFEKKSIRFAIDTEECDGCCGCGCDETKYQECGGEEGVNMCEDCFN